MFSRKTLEAAFGKPELYCRTRTRSLESRGGCLGPGVYLCREEKAHRFAQSKARHGSDEDGLVSVRLLSENPKFMRGDDEAGIWSGEGFDASDGSGGHEHLGEYGLWSR